ncbi:dihydrofolate reductase [Agromyces sp. NPDC057679]|uniref:dihydrofolate reductase n=1 Tax=Agromyces sp. NPDC057679 TaxID=3346207 RepID=UPI00366BC0E2
MNGTKLGLIWAQTLEGVIGAGGGLPWHLPEDLAHFKAVTAGRPVIMGRRTWESLPARSRPLPGRTNIVITRRASWAAYGAARAASLEEAITLTAGTPEVWVIGGGQVYAEAIHLADEVAITTVDSRTPGDTRAPELDGRWQLTSIDPAFGDWHTSATGIRYRFDRWARR